MRRSLVICALTVGIAVVLGEAYKEPVPALASAIGGRSTQSSTAKAIVIASGVSTRALALDSDAAIDLTNAAEPNRIFAFVGVASRPAGEAAASLSLVPIAGAGETGSRGDGGLATAAQFNLAPDSLSERSGVAITADGTIFIADSQNSTIRRIAGPASTEPGIIRSVAGRWAAPQNVTLTDPLGITADRAGNLYIADHVAGTIDVLVGATGELETLAHVASPASIAVTLDGAKVFVASPETGGVFAIATNTRTISAVASFAPSGSPDGPSSCPSLEKGAVIAPRGQGMCPSGLAVDGRSNLFVADANTGRIWRVDGVTNKISVAGSGLDAPGDIAFDTMGDLFVSEQGLSRLIEMPGLGDPASAISLSVPALFPPPCPQVSNPFTFCNVPSGGSSGQAAFTLTNTSPNTVTGVAVGFIPTNSPGNFTAESTGCTSSLGAGQTCQINVSFTPQTTGSLTGTLSVTDSNPADAATVSLAGTGDNYSLQLASGQQIEVTVQQGQTAVFNGQIVPDSVFGAEGESVQLVCPNSATMPVNTSCVISPCQTTVTPGISVPFQITFVTSSSTSVAPVPPQSTGCTSYGPAPTAMVFPRQTDRPSNGSPLSLPSYLASLAIFAFLIGRRSVRSQADRDFPLPRIVAVAGIAATLFVGCHHRNTSIVGPATPVGVFTMVSTGKAIDSKGNPLNTSRAMPQILLDVIAQTAKLP